MAGYKRITIALSLVIIMFIATFGLAVPRITIGVQGVGSGSCDIKSPIQWATVTLEWSKSGVLLQTWTLIGASVVFSDNVSGKINLTVTVKIEGYNSTSRLLTNTTVKGVFATTSGIVSGQSYSLTLNDTPSYVVSPFFGYSEPKVINSTGVVTGGLSSCSNIISLLVTGIGTGSTSYSPPPIAVPVINITVNNTGNPELKDYVVNFTVLPSCIPNLSKIYVTDSSGNPLYFWVFNDSTNGKIWFWVNYTVPSNVVSTIEIHLNGTAQSPYLNPDKVFWYFNGTDLSLGAYNNYTLGYNVSNFLNSGYSGYAFDTNATLGNLGLGVNWIAPYFVALQDSRGYYYGVGVADNSSIYVVQGNSPSRVSSVGSSRWVLPSWGPGIYSSVFYMNSSAPNVHMNLYFEGNNFLAGVWVQSLFLTSYFTLGQRYLGTSKYDWIGLRPIAYPSPVVTVPTDCVVPIGGGAYTFTLYFRP